MKNILFLSCLVFCVTFSWSKESEPIKAFKIISDEFDKTIPAGHYVFEGTVYQLNTSTVIKNVEINTQGGVKTISKTGRFSLKLKADGEWIMFEKEKYRSSYFENYEVKSQHRIKLKIFIEKKDKIKEIPCEKPVIYAYSDNESSFDLTLNAKGDLQFTYPQLPENKTWSMKTSSNGNLVDKNGQEFPYLFWDAKQDATIQFAQEKDVLEGKILCRKEVLPFLDSVLGQMAFNAKEKTDFITYWGPRLVQKEFCMLQFQTQDLCNQFAEYEISPKPDNFNRVYLLFTIFENKEVFLENTKINLKPQEFKSFNRSGFNFLEWGGMEFEQEYFIKNL